MSEYYVVIKADTNDADYITSINHVKPDKIKQLIEIVTKVEKYGSYNNIISWETGDYASEELWEQHPELTEDECEFLENYIPYSEHGVHTIEDIKLLKVEESITLL